jgi:glycine/D-amino acid oxidase-like deaminating enzyme
LHPDVVVIGGGIVGCSCAYYLARAGLKVHLLEKRGIGAGASRTCMSHIVTWKQPEIHMRLSRASNQLYRELAEGLPVDIEYRRTGSLAIVEEPAGMEAIGETVRSLQNWGLDCRLVTVQELLEAEPHIAPGVAGAAFFAEDAQVNPLYATQGLALGAAQCGAVIQPFASVTGIELSRHQKAVVAVRTAQERIPTKCIVNAAGAWGAEIAEMAGVDVPVIPRKGHLVVTEPMPHSLMNCKIVLSAGYMASLKASSDLALSANIQQVRNGNLLLGSSRQFAGFDTSVDHRVIELMVARCLALFPALSTAQAIRAWAGLRPYTPDLLPILGSVDTLEGFFMACGHEGIGITEGPITGRLISQAILGQEADISFEQLACSRFARHDQDPQKTKQGGRK